MKPRDKAKVEVGVQVVGRWILARLRHRRFFSLAELNAAIRLLLADLNDRPMRGWGVSRRALYQPLDRPALETLPPIPYEYVEWKRCRVSLDYHVEIAKHYYSVPKFNAAVAAGSSTGFWRMSRHPAVQQALRNPFFDSLGLPRLMSLLQLNSIEPPWCGPVCPVVRGDGAVRRPPIPINKQSGANDYGRYHLRRARDPHPGRHQSERPAGFDRNRSL
jgi:hypothetical protein